jgi:hypothetical protein
MCARGPGRPSSKWLDLLLLLLLSRSKTTRLNLCTLFFARCTGCKTARYCTIECARKDYKEGHKELCNVMKAQRLAVVEREAELKKAPKRNAFGF